MNLCATIFPVRSLLGSGAMRRPGTSLGARAFQTILFVLGENELILDIWMFMARSKR